MSNNLFRFLPPDHANDGDRAANKGEKKDLCNKLGSNNLNKRSCKTKRFKNRTF